MNWTEAVEQYDEMLNEIEGPISVGILTFDPADVLRELDPTAYRCGLLDYLDAEEIDSDTLEGEYPYE